MAGTGKVVPWRQWAFATVGPALANFGSLWFFLAPLLAAFAPRRLFQTYFNLFLRRHARRLLDVVDPYVSIDIAEPGAAAVRYSRFDRVSEHDSTHEEVQAYLSGACAQEARELRAEGAKEGDGLVVSMREGQEVGDEFRGATLWWSSVVEEESSRPRLGASRRCQRLTFHRRHRRLVVDEYLPHVRRRGREILFSNRRRRLYTNNKSRDYYFDNKAWSYIDFDHPTTFDTLAMDLAKKREIMDDLDAFRSNKDFYRRTGKPWKRGYLLCSATMVGGGAMRRLSTFYESGKKAVGATSSARKRTTTRRRREVVQEPTPVAMEEAQEVPEEEEQQQGAHQTQEGAHQQEEAQEGAEQEQAQAQEGAHQEGEASGASDNIKIYLRGPASLPRRPIPVNKRPMITPLPPESWHFVESANAHAAHKRHVNGILGVLCREHYPGLVHDAGVLVPASSFQHYAAVADVEDRDGRRFDSVQARVLGELWDFYRCEPGKEAEAEAVARDRCKRIVQDLLYEARVQAVINFYAFHKQQKIDKKAARTVHLTREEYLTVIPNWCRTHTDCWEVLVDKWVADQWKEVHATCRERRLMMPGVAHHQGSRTLSGYKEAWSASHGGQEISDVAAYALSHKGKATADISYNPEDGPEAYSNSSIHSRLREYESMARQVRGPDFDPTTQPLDGEVVMRIGGGKKHGRYWMGDSLLDSASTPTLSQIRATSTSRGPGIRPRVSPSQSRLQQLESELEAERRQREEREAAMAAQQAMLQERMSQQQALIEYQQKMMAEFHAALGTLGVTLPPSIPAPPVAPTPDIFSTPRQSEASNDPHGIDRTSPM